MSLRTLAIALSLVGLTTVSQRALALTPEEETARCENIRDVAADNGISTGFLLAGIASAETNLSHCWTELDWACQGPDSPDCGGPVVAGAGDGPCSLQQGGLERPGVLHGQRLGLCAAVLGEAQHGAAVGRRDDSVRAMRRGGHQ